MYLNLLDADIIHYFKTNFETTQLTLLVLHESCSPTDPSGIAEQERLFEELLTVVAEKNCLSKIKLSVPEDLQFVPEVYFGMVENLIARSSSIFDYEYKHANNTETPEEKAHCERVKKILIEKKANFETLSLAVKNNLHALLREFNTLTRSLSERYLPLIKIFPEENSIPAHQIGLIKFIEALSKSDQIVETALKQRGQLQIHLESIALHEDMTTGLYKALEANVQQLEELLVKISIASKKYEWECFMPNSYYLSNTWARNVEDAQEKQTTQVKFAMYCYNSVRAAAAFMLENARHIKFKEFYLLLAKHRKETAYALNQPDKIDIGILRKQNTGETPIAGSSYFDYTHELTKRLLRFLQKENPTFAEDGYIKVKVPVYDADGKVTRITDGIQIQSENILLSRIAFKLNGERDGIPRLPMRYDYFQVPHVYPADVTCINHAFEKLDEPFQLLLKSRESSLENLTRIMIIAYYLAHIMPLVRGSAATTEKTVYTLFDVCGFPMAPYQGCITLDLEAIFEPKLDSFIEKCLNKFFQVQKAFALQQENSLEYTPHL